jgi:Flp pilus assembly secretin CpaC
MINKSPPLGLAALMAVMFALQGCGSKPAAGVEPLPVSDFSVKSTETSSRAAVQSVKIVAHYVVLKGALPEAKGALAFLSDADALHAGAVLLSNNQADTALAELSRWARQDVKSMPTATVASGNAGNLRIVQELRYPVGWKKDPTSGNWTPTEIETRDVGVGMQVEPLVLADGCIQIAVTAEEMSLDILIEHLAPNERTTALAEFSAAADAVTHGPLKNVNMGPQPKPVHEPMFSKHSVEANVLLAPGQTVVLRGKWERAFAASSELQNFLKGEKAPVEKTMLVFLTAEVVPAK